MITLIYFYLSIISSFKNIFYVFPILHVPNNFLCFLYFILFLVFLLFCYLYV